MKKLYFNMATRERRAAVVENDRVVELMVERTLENRIVSNVYRGRVVNVLPGMQAAFVDIGRDKNGFLYRDDLLSFHLSNEEEEKKKERSISEFVKQGEELLVQVTKEGFGSKGPRLTGVVSFPGQFLVFMPEGNYVGVSRRFSSEGERERWREVGEAITEGKEGVIIRTSCEGKAPEIITQELHFLRKLWQELWKEGKEKKAPALIHQDSGLIDRMVRDFSFSNIEEIIVDRIDEYKLLKELLEPFPKLQQSLSLYREKENVFSAFGIEKELERALRRQIWLKNGAYLMIDQTEALTVIDVNTGKFTGKTNLHDTVRKTNSEAAIEIARQLRLRDISGIIIIDFIDMKREEDREHVKNVFEKALKHDRTKTNVLGITGLGLLEMTRKKVRQNLQASLSKTCPTCSGKGVVLSDEAQAFKIERQLWEHRGMSEEAIVLELPAVISTVLFGQKGEHLKRLEEALGFRILVYPNKHLQEEKFSIRYIGNMNEAVAQLERLKAK
ncbi:cytoplasmic axial filament protein CafA and Ribonuclease G [Halalkalibacter wakoensis JCM 9140]|uniref:Ribonuclease G n=1 Tax=Halalkalibacter wakoensis JCM 9140 TaxID=1236970 RepID=W4Q8G3_9BACI|nr:ribonuclease E/G [Halalkalibacter wakoensis]GAE27684.1 cytoplasmic axial filament protein CafA and Ribonuclease G [Halalkalibacter wakoensis JCM 9140]